MNVRKILTTMVLTVALTAVTCVSAFAGSYSSGLGGGNASGKVSTTGGSATSYFAPGSTMATRNVEAYIMFRDGDGVSHISTTKRKNTYDNLVEVTVSFSGYSNVYYLRGTHKINNETGSWPIAP